MHEPTPILNEYLVLLDGVPRGMAKSWSGWVEEAEKERFRCIAGGRALQGKGAESDMLFQGVGLRGPNCSE